MSDSDSDIDIVVPKHRRSSSSSDLRRSKERKKPSNSTIISIVDDVTKGKIKKSSSDDSAEFWSTKANAGRHYSGELVSTASIGRHKITLGSNDIEIKRKDGLIQFITITRLFKTLRCNIRVSNRKHRNETYYNCFVAHDCVDWMNKRFHMTRQQAVDACESLHLRGLIKPALPDTGNRPFVADLLFYQFNYDKPPPDKVRVATDAATAAVRGVTTVDGSNAGLTTVPEQIYSSALKKTLISLYLQNNTLRELPPQLCELRALTSLDLSHNELKTLPEDWTGLLSLQTLNLDDNELVELPATLGAISTLLELSVESNPLLCLIPSAMCRGLTALHTFKLRHTAVTILPATIASMKSLKTLKLSKPMIAWPPEHILSKEIDAILSYVHKHAQDQPPLPIIDAEQESNDVHSDAVSLALDLNHTADLSIDHATMGTSALRPKRRAPAPSVRQPWHELSDEDDAPQAELLAWSTQSSRVIALFHAALRLYRSGALREPPLPPLIDDDVMSVINEIIAPPPTESVPDTPKKGFKKLFGKAKDSVGGDDDHDALLTNSDYDEIPTGASPQRDPPTFDSPLYRLLRGEAPLPNRAVESKLFADLVPVIDAVWHLGARQAGQMFASGAPPASVAASYHARVDDLDSLDSSGNAVNDYATRSYSPRSAAPRAGSAIAARQSPLNLSGASLRAMSSSPRTTSLNSIHNSASAPTRRPSLGHHSSSGNVRAAQSLLLLQEKQYGTATSSRSQPSSPRFTDDESTSNTVATHVVWCTAPQHRFNPAPFIAPLLAINDPSPSWPSLRRVRSLPESLAVTLHNQLDVQHAASFVDVVAAHSISTYAWDRATQTRIADPICDDWSTRIGSDRAIYSVADGCGWGAKSSTAAQCATRTFNAYMHARRSQMKTPREAAHCALLAMSEANESVKAATSSNDPGTTTLVGGVVLPLVMETDDDSVDSDSSRVTTPRGNFRVSRTDSASSGIEDIPVDGGKSEYAFVLASIGDVKVFHFVASSQRVFDVSAKIQIDHAKFKSEDCGGRLGRWVEGDADLRNLAVGLVPCNRGDAFILCSDGVHDNLDPEKLGVQVPASLAAQFDGASTWSELPNPVSDFVKRKFQLSFLEGVFNKAAGFSFDNQSDSPPPSPNAPNPALKASKHKAKASKKEEGKPPRRLSLSSNYDSRMKSPPSPAQASSATQRRAKKAQDIHIVPPALPPPGKVIAPPLPSSPNASSESLITSDNDDNNNHEESKSTTKRSRRPSLKASKTKSSRSSDVPHALKSRLRTSSSRPIDTDHDAASTSTTHTNNDHHLNHNHNHSSTVPGGVSPPMVKINPTLVTEQLIAFSRFITKASRQFMWDNPRLQLPKDFTRIPGKPDHATCLTFVVGNNLERN